MEREKKNKKEKKMFSKKNIIIIALIAIFVMGAVVLSAINFQVIVHVQGSGDGWYESTNTNKVYLTWETTNNFIITDISGAAFECYGNGGINGNTDSDGGVLDPYNVNHFYLDLRPPQKDDGTPAGQ